LTFAPLAEVHRKNGDVTRALELLRPGLTFHPNYIPASIVLGRCHLDLGDLPAAETAFAHVLSLDGENVIALKALADIAERQYRFEEAERLLTTLLSFDQQRRGSPPAGRVEASRRQAGVASSASPDAVEAPTPDTEAVTAGGPGRRRRKASEHETTESKVADELAAGASPPPSEPPHEPSWRGRKPRRATATDAAPLDLNDLDLGGARTPRPGLEIEQRVTLEEHVEPCQAWWDGTIRNRVGICTSLGQVGGNRRGHRARARAAASFRWPTPPRNCSRRRPGVAATRPSRRRPRQRSDLPVFDGEPTEAKTGEAAGGIRA
jgi:hypothetical protein